MSFSTLQTSAGSHRLFLTLANSFLSRLRGLMFRTSLPDDHALLITHCSSIHTSFMRFSIDVVYLDHLGTVLECVGHLAPWRGSACPSAVHVLELAAGSIERLHIQKGDRLVHPYFQVSKTCAGLRHPLPRGQRGSATVEFMWAAPIITLLGLATLQYGLLFFAKNQINHAAFMAARAGSMDHANLNTITSTYTKALIPLYGGGSNAKELQQAQHKALSDTAGNLQIEILNPTRESFADWNDPALQARLGISQRIIPFASQQFKYAGDIRSASGQNILDANILKLRVTQGYLPQVPFMGALYSRFLKWYDGGTDAFQTQLMQKGRIPVVTSITIHMQSDAIESASTISTPGMGNNGAPTDPGMPAAVTQSPPTCITIGCITDSPTAQNPRDSLTSADPGVDGSCDPTMSCCLNA